MPTPLRLLILLSLLGVVLASPGAAAAGDAPQTRIIGGTNASDTRFPYQARLAIRSGTRLYQCGAVIRDATHVMTAAHCVVQDGTVAAPADVTVYYGAADRTWQRVAAAYGVMAAPQYVAGDSSWDAALITLSSPLVGYGGSTVNGVPLASAGESLAAVTAGADATVSGWGITEQGSVATTLRGAEVKLRQDSVCSQTYRPADFVPARFVCAGGTGTASSGNPDSCQGDSGGPLVTSTPSGVRLVGLVSFGPNSGCGQPGVPAAYTEVSNPSIAALLTGTTAEAPPSAGGSTPNAGSANSAPAQAGGSGGGQSTGVAVAPARPISQPTASTPARPSVRIVGVRCVRRRCTIRVTGDGTALTARINHRVRTCSSRRGCRSAWKRVTIRFARRNVGGYTVVESLRPGSYRVAATVSDPSGRRSVVVTRLFRVRR